MAANETLGQYGKATELTIETINYNTSTKTQFPILTKKTFLNQTATFGQLNSAARNAVSYLNTESYSDAFVTTQISVESKINT